MSNQCAVWRIEGTFSEDPVADLLVVLVEGLHGIEVAIDDDVEQAVEEEAHSVDRQVGRTVPSLEYGAIEKPSFFRTVISQRSLTNASTSVSSSSPPSTSTRTA